MKQLLFGLLCGMRSRLPKGMLVQVSNTDLKESTNIWLIILVEIHLKDKQELLTQWVNSGESVGHIETQLKVARSQEGELERGKELLTIDEMRSRGFSTFLAIAYRHRKISLFMLILFMHP